MCAAKCIDQYASLRTKAAEDGEAAEPIDPRLISIVERMFNT